MPCSLTPVELPCAFAVSHGIMTFRLFHNVGFHHQRSFGALSHGLRTPCVRFAGWVTPSPRNTRFRLPACLAEWAVTPQGPNGKFPSA